VTHPGPPYDPDLATFLQHILGLIPTMPDFSNPAEMRKLGSLLYPPIDEVLAGTGIEHVEVTTPQVDGTPGVVLSIFRRSGTPGGTLVPCIYFIHGGGMMMGDRFTGATTFPDLIDRFGVAVVSVEYRLAPEHPHPMPVDDCYAGLCWLARNGAEHGIDANRIIVYGGSAGAGLAAGVCLQARDRSGPPVIAQILSAAMLDDRDTTTSTHQFEAPSLWPRASNVAGWTALLGVDRGTETVSPYAAPARADDLSRLPPAYIDVGSAEVFRDENVDYATRIWEAGGQAELHVWGGAWHGFEMVRDAAVSQAAKAARYSWIARILST